MKLELARGGGRGRTVGTKQPPLQSMTFTAHDNRKECILDIILYRNVVATIAHHDHVIHTPEVLIMGRAENIESDMRSKLRL